MIILKKQHRENSPINWETRRLKYLASDVRDLADNNKNQTHLALENIESWTGKLLNVDDEMRLDSAKEFHKDDVLFGKLRPYLAKVHHAQFGGACVGELLVLRPKEEIAPEYLFYRLLSHDFISVVDNSTTGAKMPRAEWGFMSNLQLEYPVKKEQSAIASYLDEKCALIGHVIEGKKKQIEILEEQRAAIINRSVTKGLDEKVEIKESGIEWIGKMPKIWDIKKLKTVFRFEKGKEAGLFTKEYVSDQKNIGEYPVYSGQTEDEGVMGRINSYIYDLDATIFTTTVGAKVMTPMVIGGKFSLSQNCVLFIKQDKKIDVRYFYYQLFPMFKWEKDSIPSHMQPSLRVSDLNKYSIAYPIYEEQVKIANYIEEKTKFIDKFLKEIERSISLLNEYKTSLISHVVTGKVKVA
ncbi:restriction endonuclease subunit S [Candidatus Peregrinibacteria bacterium]|nr:restriction endonuclease subunit S [Candidatus Peregrinibacteria bacterium]